MAEILDPFREDDHVRPLAAELREIADKIDAGEVTGMVACYADTAGDLHYVLGFSSPLEEAGAALYLANAAMMQSD